MDLGQVFTKSVIARYMVSLFSVPKGALVLDPCFGEGAFLSALILDKKYAICGCEIDKLLFDKVKNKFKHITLKNSDFLQLSDTAKYDGIIMNPPYVRHEKIDDLSELGINKKSLRKCRLYKELSPTANLYMYFILKAISLLKRNGELIVIFPSSWLQAKNGDKFKIHLYKNCAIERQIYVSGNAFEKSALVDVIILKLRKNGKQNMCTPEFVKLDGAKLIKLDVPANNELSLCFNVPFNDICKIKRGITTGCNKFFINPALKDRKYKRSILSSPKQIVGYSTKGAISDSVLVVDDDSNDKGLHNFISSWKKKILESAKQNAFIKKICNDDKWYKIKLFDCRGILFSYFIRNDMKFVLNKNYEFVRDNFYVLIPRVEENLCLALLNNFYTYYQLEMLGKKYGAGLLKIQRYDIEKLMFPDVAQMDSADVEHLQRLSKKLVETGDKQIIEQITLALSKYSLVSFDYISTEYANIVKSRLGAV